MGKPITNKHFESYLNSPECRKIITKVVSQYNNLTLAQKRRCGLLGLLKALQQHQTGFTTKFTSSLWRHVRWECLKEIRSVSDDKRRKRVLIEKGRELLPSESNFTPDDIQHLRVRMTTLPQELQNVLRMKYLDELTVNEIRERTGYSVSVLYRKINQGLTMLKEQYLRGIEE